MLRRNLILAAVGTAALLATVAPASAQWRGHGGWRGGGWHGGGWRGGAPWVYVPPPIYYPPPLVYYPPPPRYYRPPSLYFGYGPR